MSGKNWCFTLNNYTEEKFDSLLDCYCKYIIMGKEVGATGTPHLQGFVVFHTTKRLSGVKKIDPLAHWEQAKGSASQNKTYCSKDGNHTERGVCPMTSKEQGAKSKTNWALVIKAAKSGDAEELYPREFVQYNTTLTKMYKPLLAAIPVYCGFWYVGPPGTGKSKTARENFPGAYDKLLNKWWDGYDGEESVLIDDIGMSNELMGSFLKRYCDHYPFRAEHKGGSKVIRPLNIVVTSNYTIETIWPHDSQLQAALLRRFKVVNFYSQFPS